MKIKHLVLLVISLGFINLLKAEAYFFDSPNFNEVTGDYSTEMKVSLSIQTFFPISSNVGLVNIVDELIDYNISDSVQILTPSNSKIIYFEVGVNRNNQITSAAITVWRDPVPTQVNPTASVSGIDLYFDSNQFITQGFIGGSCLSFNGENETCSLAEVNTDNLGLYVDEIFRNGFDF